MRNMDIPVLGAVAQDLARRFGDTFVGRVASGALATVIGVSLLSIPWTAYKLYALNDDISETRAEIRELTTKFEEKAEHNKKTIRRNRELIYSVRNKVLKLKEQDQ